MNKEEFLRAILSADFSALVSSESYEEFYNFVQQELARGKDRFVVRFLLHWTVEKHDVPTPYYVWAVYPLREGDELEIIQPDFDKLNTFLNVPDELRDENFFEVIVSND